MYCNPSQVSQKLQELPDNVKAWLLLIAEEMQRASDKHPDWPTNPVHGPELGTQGFVYAAAIVGEESGELLRAAIQYEHEGGDYIEMHKEAIQTGAMALRFLVNAPEAEGCGSNEEEEFACGCGADAPGDCSCDEVRGDYNAQEESDRMAGYQKLK
jgi:hypothetical protein